jgi:glutamyl-tRNA synthetase
MFLLPESVKEESRLQSYRGRVAPSPTGFLHVGHAYTFSIAHQRAREAHGTLIFRNEDLDPQRCRAEYVSAMFEDLAWLGIDWDEGPDRGGPFGPYAQSERRASYLVAWKQLRDQGAIYPCTCSRRELAEIVTAPNGADDEPIYPGKCRNRADGRSLESPKGLNWRFRVPDGETVRFIDLHQGPQSFVVGKDFGDFVVFRRDDVPAYQLAVVVDDAEMQVSEIVRGADLLKSTARQILLARALQYSQPHFYHCDLVGDESGARLAKRHDGLSIRELRARGCTPEQVLDLGQGRLFNHSS